MGLLMWFVVVVVFVAVAVVVYVIICCCRQCRCYLRTSCHACFEVLETSLCDCECERVSYRKGQHPNALRIRFRPRHRALYVLEGSINPVVLLLMTFSMFLRFWS